MKMFTRAAIACAAVAAVMLGAVLPSQASTSPGWRQVFSKHYGAANAFSLYQVTVASARNDAWALGASNVSGVGADARPVAVHWNGRRWSPVALPKAATGEFIAASAPAPDDIWAVTHLSGQILHWNGKAWSVVKTLPEPKGPNFAQLTGVVALSATNVWVFGSSGFTLGWGTWHYDGKSWRLWHGYAADITDGSAVSPSNIWAIGGLNAPQSLIVHFTGTTWRPVTGRVFSGLQFEGIRAFSATNVWASASSVSAPTQSWVLHYNGHAWSKFKLPWSTLLLWDAIVADGHHGLWLIAFVPGTSRPQYYAIRRNAAGAWGRTRVGVQLFGLARIPGTASIWSVGATFGTANGSAVIWGYGKI
jgi:hypothetical protein